MAHVLVVEDDAVVREVVRMMLEINGHSVQEACDGRAALALLGHVDPDVVLLDCMLPLMDAWALAPHLYKMAQGGSLQTKVVVMTAGRAVHQAAQDIGTPYALAKPFGLKELQRMIERALATPDYFGQP